jgi:hypothetical protein
MSDDPADVDLVKPTAEQPAGIAGRRRPPLVPLAVAAVLLLGLVGAYLYLRTPSREPAVSSGAPVDQSQRRPAEKAEQISLPPLDETDPLVRQLIGRLSSHPVVGSWLATDGLLLNFSVVTMRIANRESPAKELGRMGPVGVFRPRTAREDLFVDPSSYRRYDRYAAAVSALDARGVARLYETLKPRINDAYRRMGPPTGDFDPVLEQAIVQLLAVPIVDGDIELVPSGIVYAFLDPKLEELSPAQKHLLRMGPQSVQAIQGKLREIADYLAIPTSRLPRPTAMPR